MRFSLILASIFAQVSLQDRPTINQRDPDRVWPSHSTSAFVPTVWSQSATQDVVESPTQPSIVSGDPNVVSTSVAISETSASSVPGVSGSPAYPTNPAEQVPSCNNTICIQNLMAQASSNLTFGFNTTSGLQLRVTWALGGLDPTYEARKWSIYLVQYPSTYNRQAASPKLLQDNQPAHGALVWDPSSNNGDIRFSHGPNDYSYAFKLASEPSTDGTTLLEYEGKHFDVIDMNSVSPTSSSGPANNTAVATSPASTPLAAQNTVVAASSQAGLSTNQKLGIGLGIGLGVPFIVALAAGMAVLFRRRASKRNTDPYSRQPLNPSHEDVIAGGYTKGFDHSPPLPPLPPQPQTGAIAAGAAVAVAAGTLALAGAQERDSRNLHSIDTAMPTPATGVDASPVSPLSHRSSVSSMSTMEPGGTGARTLTFSSEHH